jgi:ribosomal protein S18 acetylase RimI-like enzyme
VEFAVRDAVCTDAPAIARVHVASWRAAYAGLMPVAVLDGLSVDARAATWTRLITAPDHDVLVLTAPEVVGFASFGADRGDPTAGELYAIYLDPAWWSRGAGRLLHDAAVERLDAERPRSTLWVLRTNERAIRFYRAAGWRPDGTEKVEEGPGGALLAEARYVRARPRSQALP